MSNVFLDTFRNYFVLNHDQVVLNMFLRRNNKINYNINAIKAIIRMRIRSKLYIIIYET